MSKSNNNLFDHVISISSYTNFIVGAALLITGTTKAFSENKTSLIANNKSKVIQEQLNFFARTTPAEQYYLGLYLLTMGTLLRKQKNQNRKID